MLDILATIPVGAGPIDLTVSPDGTQVYAVNTHDATVSVIDTASETVTATIGLAMLNSHPLAAVVHPNGAHLYVGVLGGRVSVIDTATNTEVSEFFVGGSLPVLAIHPDGSRLYATLIDSDGTPSGDVAVIDTASHVVTATFSVGPSAGWPLVSPDGSRVYFPDFVGHTVAVVDTATNTIQDTFDVAASPIRFAVTPDGTRLYATDGMAGTVAVIDTVTGAQVETIPVAGLQAFGIAITPDGTRIYVSLQTGAVSVIDTTSNTVSETLSGVGTLAAGLAVAGLRLYAANSLDNTVTAIAQGIPQFHGRVPKLTGKLVGGVAAGGDGGLVIGRHIFKVPPHTPAGLNVEAVPKAR